MLEIMKHPNNFLLPKTTDITSAERENRLSPTNKKVHTISEAKQPIRRRHRPDSEIPHFFIGGFLRESREEDTVTQRVLRRGAGFLCCSETGVYSVDLFLQMKCLEFYVSFTVHRWSLMMMSSERTFSKPQFCFCVDFSSNSSCNIAPSD